MPCDQSTFDSFLRLPWEAAAADVVEISSSDDEDDIQPQADILWPQQAEETPKGKVSAVCPIGHELCTNHRRDAEQRVVNTVESAAFRKAISASIPIKLVDVHVRQQLRAAATRALEIAVSCGATLDAVHIDANYFTTWPGRGWDPDMISLHQVVQARLVECQNAQALGSRLRAALVQLGNERLEEARVLGLRLEDLTIGEDLLPTWHGRHGPGVASEDDDTTVVMGSRVHSDDQLPSGIDCAVKEESKRCMGKDSCHSSAPGSDTDASDSESTREADPDDEVSLFNFISQHHADDEERMDAPHSNVVHDVEVLGAAPEQGCCLPVDFEVYLAQDDSDWELLPEVELAVDEAAFEHHYHMEDVIEVELAEG
ncbi:hypothetical protein V2A60_008196 [Cordyceps javanica]